MNIGIVKEIKTEEYRVGMTPSGVRQLVESGHRVYVQEGAGLGSGFDDEEYKKAGAVVCPEPSMVYENSEMVVKVKEPQPVEYGYLREGLILFCYLHLAADRELTQVLMQKRVVAMAFETVQEDKRLPLLEPMSQIAGRMAPIVGGYFLSRPQGGEGILLAGASGVMPANVLVLGGGTVGANAARVASALGAHVTVADIDTMRLRRLEEILPAGVATLFSTPDAIGDILVRMDIVVGAVLVAGAKTPVLIRKTMLGEMKKGSIIVDVAIDQGGCCETSRPTTHDNPVYAEDGVLHYCVTNMPGAYPRTSALALSAATLPYVLEIASKGWKMACRKSQVLAKGVNVAAGHLTNSAVAQAHGFAWHDLQEIVG